MAYYSIPVNVWFDHRRPRLPSMSLRTLLSLAANLHHKDTKDRARMF
jgi:hypothetical protein